MIFRDTRLFKRIPAFIAALLLSGCASLYVPPVPKVELPSGAKVGLYVEMADFPKHTHVGTTVFNNFSREYQYDWKLEQEIYDAFSQGIQSGSGLEVVDLKQHGIDDVVNFVKIEDKEWRFTPESAPVRDRLRQEGIQAVVFIRGDKTLALLECGAYGCAEQYADGYGLFTRSFLGLKRFYSTAGFYISVELLQQPVEFTSLEEFAALTKYDKKTAMMRDFSSPDDFRNISEQELQPVKSAIMGYVDTLVQLTVRHLNGS